MLEAAEHRRRLKALAKGIVCAGLLSVSSTAQVNAMSNANTRQRMISVEHVEIHSAKPFDEVVKVLEATVKPLDPNLREAMAKGDVEAAEKIVGKEPLFIFSKRDHGAILRIAGQSRKAIQYEIGNPMTATEMTRHRIEASLYAPLRVTLYENESSGCTFAYDQPSSLFGQFDDGRVTAVAQGLDQELKAVLLRAAE
jgi:uncharacterized protein (DUF302 family)